MVTIVEVTSRKQKKLFATFPIDLYKDNIYYVPLFIDDEMNLDNPKKNLYKGTSEIKCFLAFKGNELVGRIAGIINHDANKMQKEKCIRFCRIDFIDDIEVSKALIEAVEDWGKANGLNVIHGPWGFNDADREGMLSYGFDEYSTYAAAYSHPYYVKHLEKLGFKKEAEWIEYRFDITNIDPRYFRTAALVKKEDKYHDVCREMSLKQVIKKYGDSFFDCYNKAYEGLNNFVPFNSNAKIATLKEYVAIANDDYVSVIVERATDKVVSFAVALPYIGDALRASKGKKTLAIKKTIKHPKKLELAILGIDPAYRKSGAHTLMFTSFYDNCIKGRIEDVVVDPILTQNISMIDTWQWMNKTIRAKHESFRKDIK